jgi:transposase-like protein
MSRSRRTFSEAVKRRAVEEYVSGRKSAAQIAAEHGIAPGRIYKWKAQLEETARGERIEALTESGLNPEQARRFQQLEDELAVYRRKVGEQAVMSDLLKKLRGMPSSVPESELTGLIAITKSAARKRGRGK